MSDINPVNGIRAVTVTKIIGLNEHEKKAIREALTEYIFNHGEREAWAQRVVLDEMLPNMFWGAL